MAYKDICLDNSRHTTDAADNCSIFTALWASLWYDFFPSYRTSCFIINYAAYFSEIYRGGIESIPQGQFEAGQVLGMTKFQIFFKVILQVIAYNSSYGERRHTVKDTC